MEEFNEFYYDSFMKKVIIDHNNDDYTYLTPSQYASALNISPFTDAETLFKERKRLVEPKPVYKPAVEHGIHYENTARNCFMKSMKDYEYCGCIKGHYIHPHYPFLAGSPDGLLYRDFNSFIVCDKPDALLEIKCPYSERPYTSIGYFFYYIPQVQGYLDLFDLEIGYLYSWTKSNGCTTWKITKDKYFVSEMHRILCQFHQLEEWNDEVDGKYLGHYILNDMQDYIIKIA